MCFIVLWIPLLMAQRIEFVPANETPVSYHEKYICSEEFVKPDYIFRRRRLIRIDGRYYRFEVYDNKKKGVYSYFGDLQEIEPTTEINIGDPIRIIQSDTTVNDGLFYLIAGKNHFAVVKTGEFGLGGEFGSNPMINEKGADIFVFTNDLDLLFKQSTQLSTKDRNGKVLDIRISDGGTVSLLSTLKDPTMVNSIGDVSLLEISQLGVVKNSIDSERMFNCQLREFNDGWQNAIAIGLNSDKDRIKISSITCENESSRIIEEMEFSIIDFLSRDNSSFTDKFVNDTYKSEKLLISLEAENTSTEVLFLKSGGTLTCYPIMVQPSKKMGLNKMLCTIVILQDSSARIKWMQVLPIEQALLTLFDESKNIHVFSNGAAEGYADNVFIGTRTERSIRNRVPIEIVLDFETGEILENKLFENEAFPEGYIFVDSRNRVRGNLNESRGVIGIIKMGESEKPYGENITFGYMEFRDE